MVKPLPVGVVFVIVRGNCKKFGKFILPKKKKVL